MNTVGNLLDAYYSLLDGQVTNFSGYKITAPESETGSYYIMYPESGGDDNNKDKKVETVIIRIDIVTKFVNDASQTECEDADEIIKNKIKPDSRGNALQVAAGLQVLNVKREDYTYLIEKDGTDVYYRKVTRYTNRVIQT